MNTQCSALPSPVPIGIASAAGVKDADARPAVFGLVKKSQSPIASSAFHELETSKAGQDLDPA